MTEPPEAVLRTEGLTAGYGGPPIIEDISLTVRAGKITAIGVAPDQSLATIRAEADEVVCLETPVDFFAVGQFFEDFSEVTDEMVVAELSRVHAA